MNLLNLGYASRPPLDISGARIIFTVKESPTDGEPLVRIQKDNLSGGIEVLSNEGEIVLTLTPGDMSLPASDYYYDVFVIRDARAHSSEPNIFRVTPTVLGVLP